MADVHTPAQRSYNMSMIRGANTGPELVLRKALWRLGYRYRLSAKFPGKPDLVFPRYRLVVFIDGCFWHGCAKHLNWPRNNAAFWKKKILGNKARDIQVTREIKRTGWSVIRIWEHEIKRDLDKCVQRVTRQLQKAQ